MSSKSGVQIAVRLALPVLGLLCVAGAMAAAAITGDFSRWTLGLGVAGAILFLSIFFTWEKGNLLNFLHLGIYCVFVCGSIVLLYRIAANHPRNWDLTKDKIHSLTPQTEGFLRSLGHSVKIVAFVNSNDLPRTEQFLKLYQVANPARVSVEAHDPDVDPLFTRTFDENVYPGDYYVVREDAPGETKRKKVTLGAFSKDSERQLTNAIIEILRDRTTRVYFLDGHGEKPLSAPSNAASRAPDDSLASVQRILEERAYPCDTLNLLERGVVPEDAALLVIAGPRQDLFEIETEILRDYMAEGGKLLVLLDPILKRGARTPNLLALLREYGVETPPNSIVADLVSAQTPLGASAPVVREFGRHQIVEGMPGGVFFLAEARPIRAAAPAPEGLTVTELLKTGPSCWVEDVDTLLDRGKFDPPSGGGAVEPLAVAVSGGKPGPRGEPRLVVVGDSDTFTEAAIGNYTATFFLQSVNWLAQKEDLLAIPPKVITETPITLTTTRFWMLVFSLGLMVLIVLFGGLGYTVLRRKLG